LFTTPENFTVGRGQTAELKVHLVREAGFTGEVDVWAEGLPAGVTGTRGRFRSDQLFEPNADGADMVIPELTLTVTAAAGTQTGPYVIRVFGSPVADTLPKRVVEACSTLMLGPLLDAWNFVRRPRPAIHLTVVVPSAAQISSTTRNVQVEPGGSAIVELNATGLPIDTRIQLFDLPAGVTYKVAGREETKVKLLLEASPEAVPGTYEVSAEADVGDRRLPSGPVSLTVRTAH
jgi:hypothetical protein